MTDIAVVIPCRDDGRTLREALASALAQTRAPREVVVVDDGSTDVFTRQVLASIREPGVRVVRALGRGVAHARDLGVRLTTAPYVVLLDADDALLPGYFEAAGALLDRDPTLDFVSCGHEAFGGADYRWIPPQPEDVAGQLADGSFDIASMLRRSLWQALGGHDPSLAAHEDWEFWLRVVEAGRRGVVLPEPMRRYRIRAGSRNARGLLPGVYGAVIQDILTRRRGLVTRAGFDLLARKDAVLAAQSEGLAALEARRAALVQEYEALGRRIEVARERLARRGEPAVSWGDLARAEMFSPFWGVERGLPLDRNYIEAFLEAHRADIRGRVLEVKDDGYTRGFGGHRVTVADVLDVDPTNQRATIVADLTSATAIATDTYDCFVLTQTLHIIYDVKAALSEALRILRPGGVLLCTLPVVSRVNDEDGGIDRGDYWRFTEAAARRLLAELLPPEAFSVTARGNVLGGAAFLYGLTAVDVPAAALERDDPFCPVVICVRAVKPASAARSARPRPPAPPGTVLLYHRVGAAPPDPFGLCTPREAFRAHMEHLARHCNPLPLEELVQRALTGTLPERAVAVTLDDGTRDSLDAADELAAAGVPATFFVTTERLDVEREAWHDVLTRALLVQPPAAEALELDVEGARRRWPTRSAAERADALRAVHLAVLRLPGPARDAVLAQVVAWRGPPLPPRESHRLLTGAELASLAARPGVRIGSHSVSHLWLPTQPPEVVREEAAASRQELERRLGQPIACFAYPFGADAPGVIEALRGTGYALAVTTEPAVVTEASDPLRIPRFVVAAAADELPRWLEGVLTPGVAGPGSA